MSGPASLDPREPLLGTKHPWRPEIRLDAVSTVCVCLRHAIMPTAAIFLNRIFLEDHLTA